MTVDDVLRRFCEHASLPHSRRGVRGWIAAWASRQSDPRVPRVVLHRTGKRGRPAYRVDAESFERWRRGLAAVEPAQALAA
jgi:hypothetical protein